LRRKKCAVLNFEELVEIWSAGILNATRKKYKQELLYTGAARDGRRMTDDRWVLTRHFMTGRKGWNPEGSEKVAGGRSEAETTGQRQK
jgi:hypothetical protein